MASITVFLLKTECVFPNILAFCLYLSKSYLYCLSCAWHLVCMPFLSPLGRHLLASFSSLPGQESMTTIM